MGMPHDPADPRCGSKASSFGATLECWAHCLDFLPILAWLRPARPRRKVARLLLCQNGYGGANR